MKVSEEFEATIEAYLKERARSDCKFAEEINKQGKSVHECCNFILNTVHRSGVSGFTDDEIYSLAIHYYDEDITDESLLKDIQCSAVVNHAIELTDAEKIASEERVKTDYYNECMAKQRESNKPKPKKKAASPKQQELFGEM